MSRAATIEAPLRARAPVAWATRGNDVERRYSACSPSLKALSVMRFSKSA